MKIGLLTSIDTRHRYFAQRLCKQFNVVAVGYEATGYDPAGIVSRDLTPDETNAVRRHFEERARQELAYFGHDSAFIAPSTAHAVSTIQPGRLNSPETLALLQSRGVDTLVVYGTNLLKPPLLDAFAGRMVNLHLGLSPYYRGTATNFYPLLNEEPQYVGATIHLIDAGIDTGPIVRHARPTITAGDAPHTLGCKAILAGIEAMIATLHDLQDGRVHSTPQWRPKNARLYLRKDYHPRQVVELYRKWDHGLIERYLERLRRGEATVRLIDGPSDHAAPGGALSAGSASRAYPAQVSRSPA